MFGSYNMDRNIFITLGHEEFDENTARTVAEQNPHLIIFFMED